MRAERGQSSILMLGVVAVALAGALILGAFGQAYGARGHAQRVADLAAIAGAQSMRQNYPRLFEPPSNPQHLGRGGDPALAPAAAGGRGGRKSGRGAPGGAGVPPPPR